jgi:hypothetical protein
MGSIGDEEFEWKLVLVLRVLAGGLECYQSDPIGADRH